jgi:hypothetical protein
MVAFLPSWFERYAAACRHVIGGRRVIQCQHDLIERKKTQGHDAAQSEELLADFERSQAIFEADLERIEKQSR